MGKRGKQRSLFCVCSETAASGCCVAKAGESSAIWFVFVVCVWPGNSRKKDHAVCLFSSGGVLSTFLPLVRRKCRAGWQAILSAPGTALPCPTPGPLPPSLSC